jgi:hypothetical protein
MSKKVEMISLTLSLREKFLQEKFVTFSLGKFSNNGSLNYAKK